MMATANPNNRNGARDRLEDKSTSVWVLEKIGAPVVVACSLSILGTAIAQFLQVRELTAEMTRTKERVTVLESTVVTMEMLKRMELMMQAAAASGNGDKSMAAIAASIRMELEGQKERRSK